MFTGDDIKQFRQRLAETIAWCAERGPASDPTGGLRTEALRPADLTEIRIGDPEVFGRRQTIVAALADQRAALLRAGGVYPNVPAEGLAGGRLLLFNPDDSLSDGAAEVASIGFCDFDNAPP